MAITIISKALCRTVLAAALCGVLAACESDEQRLRDAQVAHMVTAQEAACKAKGLAPESDAYAQCVNEVVKTAKDVQAREQLNKYLAANPWSERP